MLLRPDDLFLPRSRRSGGEGFWVRLDSLGATAGTFLDRYASLARSGGVTLEDRIPNPDERQISDFRALGEAPAGKAQIDATLQRWLPDMPAAARQRFSAELADILETLRRQGKPAGALSNICIKLLCWLRFRFGTVARRLTDEDVPKVLFEGLPGTQEGLFLRALSAVGADVLLLQADPSRQSTDVPALSLADPAPFPAGFRLQEWLKGRPAPAGSSGQVPPPNRAGQVPPPNRAGQVPPPNRAGQVPPPNRAGQVPPPNRAGQVPPPNRAGQVPPVPRRAGMHLTPPSQRPPAPPAVPAVPMTPGEAEKRFRAPERSACTNAWLPEPDYRQIAEPLAARGDDPKLYYNAFIRISGVQDKLTYQNELMTFADRLKRGGRPFVIVNEGFGTPDPDEVSRVRRRGYRSVAELIIDQALNLPAGLPEETEFELKRAFARTMEAAWAEDPDLHRLTTTAVYLHCWLARFRKELPRDRRPGDIPCLIHMGPCRRRNEALFLRMLAALPVDVLILAPNRDDPCCVEDPSLLDLKYDGSLPNMPFPVNDGTLRLSTAAAHAEREITEMLYTDSGMYRNNQFASADALILSSTWDEVSILWDQELRFRTGFETGGGKVTMPVIFARGCGVPEQRDRYWPVLKQLAEVSNAFYAPAMPILRPGDDGPMMPLARKYLQGDRLLTERLKQDRQWPYGMLREEIQDHILAKLRLMLDRRMIRGIFENGMEYRVISVVLSLPKELVRQLQAFDFTKKNPKLVCVAARETAATVEDAILLTFLSLAGFDVVMFVPTGYQTIERWQNGISPVSHELGPYVYDLNVPDLSTIQLPRSRHNIFDIFKRR